VRVDREGLSLLTSSEITLVSNHNSVRPESGLAAGCLASLAAKVLNSDHFQNVTHTFFDCFSSEQLGPGVVRR